MRYIYIILLFFSLPILGQHKKAVRLNEATMDISNAIIGSDKALQGLLLPQAFDGSGVVVGVTDIGFDFTHPNFENTNIRAFWDLVSVDTLNSHLPLFMGRDYTAEELRTLQHSCDGLHQTHGTHVMGSAVGGDDLYRGVAPKADVVVVGNVLSNNYEMLDSLQKEKILGTPEHEMHEFKYMFDEAEKLGKPCVINISAGSRQSFGDDFPLYNQQISELCGPGRIIVAAAGNNGGQKITLHKKQGQQSVGSRAIITNTPLCYLFFQGDCECSLLYADEEGGEKKLVPEALYEAIDTISDYDGSFVRYYILQHEKMEGKGKYFYAQLSGSGEGFLFTQGIQYQNSGKDDGFNDAVEDYGVNFPACYDDVICVGGTDHRNEIINYEGKTRSVANGDIGMNYKYSSLGPRLDGYQKPDVCAPGSCVISSYNSFYLEEHPNAGDNSWDKERFEHNGRTYAWNSNSGTSMSSPIVAGVIALWLQANPNLTPQDIKDIIKRTSKHPDPNMDYPNALYGWGEIDAYAGLLDILGVTAIDEVSKEHVKGFRFGVEEGVLTISSEYEALHNAASLGNVAIYTTGGKLVHRENLALDGGVQRISLQHLPKGIYAVQINGKENKGSTLIRL